MTKIIEDNEAQLIFLCKKYKVAELDVFGSAATGDFDPARSDIDFLVEFQKTVARDRFDNFFNLLNELKQLFGREIDLVEPGGMRNPYFIEMVNQTKRIFYVAPQP